MFDILLNHTTEQCSQLSYLTSDMRRLAMDLEEMASNVSSNSGMNEIMGRLRACVGQMYDERDGMEQMTRALERINESYTGCEECIITSAEQSGVLYRRLEVARNNLTGYAGALDGIFIS